MVGIIIITSGEKGWTLWLYTADNYVSDGDYLSNRLLWQFDMQDKIYLQGYKY